MCVCQSGRSGDLLHVPIRVKTSSESIKSYILIVAEVEAEAEAPKIQSIASTKSYILIVADANAFI